MGRAMRKKLFRRKVNLVRMMHRMGPGASTAPAAPSPSAARTPTAADWATVFAAVKAPISATNWLLVKPVDSRAPAHTGRQQNQCRAFPRTPKDNTINVARCRAH